MRPAVLIIALMSVLAACGERERTVAPIRLDVTETIGAEDGPGSMATWPRVSPRHPQGYRILVPQPGGVAALPAAYGDSGEFLGFLGATGDTPESFSEPLFVRFGPGDSVYVFDGARRALVFSPSRQYARTIHLPVTPWDAAVLPDGRMIVASSIHEHPLPLVVLHPDGSVAGEIGASDSASMNVPSPRRVIVGPDGTIWTMPMMGRWRVEHWDLAGKLIAAVDRAPSWYPPYRRDLGTAAGRAPNPALQDAWFDAGGRLWVLGKAVDTKWEDGLETTEDSLGTRATIEDPDKVSDTVLEVFTTAPWGLVAEARFDPVYPFAVEPGIVTRVKTTSKGWHRAELARIVLDPAHVPSAGP